MKCSECSAMQSAGNHRKGGYRERYVDESIMRFKYHFLYLAYQIPS